ncbi:MAG TPA: hypothetical protein VF142_02085 [Longimicrobium sp.]
MAARTPRGGDDFGKYLKTAFLYRWNLLAFLGAAAAAALSGHADALMPIVAAGELAYLGSMVSFPRFRKAVDAQGYRSAHFAEPQKEDPRIKLATLVSGLPPRARQRFDTLRERCLRMRDIAQGVRGAMGGAAAGDDLRTPALDRLLWVFLRLLVSQASLQQFLATTDEGQLQQRVADLKKRLEAAQAEQDERVLRSLTDSLQVAELRLDNFQKARDNAEFVEIELDRIETKIQALTEMGVNRQDPDFLTSQVDAAADSMAQTETAITELQNITGLVSDLEEPPPILESDLRSTAHDHA